MKNVKLNKKGFSLIELMVVVAIIGILAAIAVPNFQRFQRKSRQAEAKGLLGSYHTALNAHAAEVGCFRGNFIAIGFQPNGELYYRLVTAHNGGCALPNGVTVDGPACITTAAGTCNGALAGYERWTERAATVQAPATAAAMANNTFTAASAANLGTATNDEWTINENKLLNNVTSGL